MRLSFLYENIDHTNEILDGAYRRLAGHSNPQWLDEMHNLLNGKKMIQCTEIYKARDIDGFIGEMKRVGVISVFDGKMTIVNAREQHPLDVWFSNKCSLVDYNDSPYLTAWLLGYSTDQINYFYYVRLNEPIALGIGNQASRQVLQAKLPQMYEKDLNIFMKEFGVNPISTGGVAAVTVK